MVPTVSPDALSVKVINSSGVGGLAVQASEALAVQGFEISGRDNGTVGEVTGAVIRHPADQAEAAVTLQAAFPGSTLVPDSSLTDGFEVELGAGAPSVVEVPNRLGTTALPEQPIVATPGGSGSGSTPSLTARVASDETCT